MMIPYTTTPMVTVLSGRASGVVIIMIVRIRCVGVLYQA